MVVWMQGPGPPPPSPPDFQVRELEARSQLPEIPGQEVLRKRGGQTLRYLAGLARGAHPHPKGSSYV